MTSIAMKPLVWTPFGTFLMICAKAWRVPHRWCFTARRSQKAPKYDSKIKKTRIEHPTWIKQLGCLLLFLGLWNCWYMLIPVCPACSSCSFLSGYTWTTYDNEWRGSEKTPCWHRDSEAWATAPGREVTEDDGWQWSETLAMELIPIWSYITYIRMIMYVYDILWIMNYDYVWYMYENIRATPGAKLQRRGFPFPIKCCCNFTFNWEDQRRYWAILESHPHYSTFHWEDQQRY